MVGGSFKVGKHQQWSPSLVCVLKFNVAGAAKGKLRQASRSDFVLNLFIDAKDSKEAEILSILETLRLFSALFRQPLIVESDSLNAISWVSNAAKGLWKAYFCLDEIKFLSSELDVEFRHILPSMNEEADVLAKRGLHRSSFFFVH